MADQFCVELKKPLQMLVKLTFEFMERPSSKNESRGWPRVQDLGHQRRRLCVKR